MPKIVHLGLPKSASSSLQFFFAECAGVQYIGKNRDASFVNDRVQHIHRKLVPNPAFDMKLIAGVARRFKDSLKESGVAADSYLLSDELLSGIGFARFRRGAADLPTIIDRLRHIHGTDTQFILVVREQKRLLKSYHGQLIRRGYAVSFETFLSRQGTDHPDSLHRGVEYGLIVQRCRSAGALLNVFIFEELMADLSPLLRLFADWGIASPGELPSINKGSTDQRLEQLLAKNRVGKGRRAFIKCSAEEIRDDAEAYERSCEHGVSWAPDHELQRLNDLFRADNNVLSQQLEKNLAGFGYAV